MVIMFSRETKKRKGIPRFSLSDVDLDYALKLLSLPGEIGKHPENGEVVSRLCTSLDHI